MSTVLETLEAYDLYLRYERHLKPATLRKVALSLKYFAEMLGTTETKLLKPSHMYMFYEHLRRRKSLKAIGGEHGPLCNVYFEKIMTHVKSYVKRLSDNAYL